MIYCNPNLTDVDMPLLYAQTGAVYLVPQTHGYVCVPITIIDQYLHSRTPPAGSIVRKTFTLSVNCEFVSRCYGEGGGGFDYFPNKKDSHRHRGRGLEPVV